MAIDGMCDNEVSWSAEGPGTSFGDVTRQTRGGSDIRVSHPARSLSTLWREWLRVLLVGGLACLVLLASVTFGPRVPGMDFLNPLRGRAQLDYGLWPFGQFAPLRAGFVSDVLGDDGSAGDAGSAKRSPDGPLADGSASGASSDAPQERVVLEHGSSNDDFDDAVSAPSVPFTARTSSAQASRQGGEPSTCAPVGGTLWYRYRPRADVGLIANTFATKNATALAVFTGTELDKLGEVGCATNARGNAQVPFPAKGGTTYYFQVTAPAVRGEMVFNLELQGLTTLASVTSTGEQADRESDDPYISDDGRIVVFVSRAVNLRRGPSDWHDPICPNGPPSSTQHPCRRDVYVHDLATTKTTTASGGPSAELGVTDGGSFKPELSGNGRYVVFLRVQTDARYERAFDKWSKGEATVYAGVEIHDRVTGRTEPLIGGVWHQDGEKNEQNHYSPSLSGSGRYVCFMSKNAYIVEGDTNHVQDSFVLDRRTGKVERVSLSWDGKQQDDASSGSGTAGSTHCGISRNGRYVTFDSPASNLVPHDTNGKVDTFLRDRVSRTTKRVSVASSGEEADGDVVVAGGKLGVNISDDGRHVVFLSSATNLVENDTNRSDDVFVRDIVLGETTRVSVSSSGEEAQVDSLPYDPDEFVRAAGTSGAFWRRPPNSASFSMTRDGRFVVFTSSSSNLVAGDENGVQDVFLHDRVRRITTRLSVSSTGVEGNGWSGSPRISADGRTVAFTSSASQLVAGDSNATTDVFVHRQWPE